MWRALCPVLILAGAAFAETQSGVVRSGGQPIPGATVSAECNGERISTVTDEFGQFEMGGLPTASCQFSVSIFGFETVRREAQASSSPLTFDLKLQTRATLPRDETAPRSSAAAGAQAEAGGANGRPQFRRRAEAGQATGDRTTNQNGPGRGGFGRGDGFGRGGFPPDGRGRAAADANSNAANGQNGGNSGFQNLNLLQNGDTPADAEIAPSPAGPADSAGANEAFLVTGSLSQGVLPQPGDAIGLGGPGGFGRGGPGDGFGLPLGANAFAGGQDGGAAGTANGGNAVPNPGGFATGPGGGGGGGFGGGGFGGGGGGFGGGGRGGGGFGGRGPGRGGPPNRNTQFGNRIRRGRGRQFQGNAYYTIGNSVLNARPYSFTAPALLNGQEVPKSGYAANRFGFSGGGPLSIPHLFSSDKTFWFVNYTGTRSKNPVDQVSTVPTAAMRLGDFSGTPYAAYSVPASRIDPAATELLKLIPLPNAPGLRNNYQLITSQPSNTDNLQVRLNQTLNTKDRLDVNFNFQRRDSETIQAFGFADPTTGYGVSSSLTYSRTFSRSLINNTVFSFSRNLNRTNSYFSFGQDIEGLAGIAGVSADPANYGPPTVTFTNFGSLTDKTPLLTRLQTTGISDSVINIRGRQTITYGFGIQRRQNNLLTDANGRGTFNFTGLSTGYDFADFLLSLPQSSSVARYVDQSRYLRETALNAYASDDWRIRSNLTVNAGLRWEYFSPYTEKYGRMASLDFAPDFTAVAVVTPGHSGPYSGEFPTALIKPDYHLVSPRIGIAWKPWKDRQIVARAGYGIYYNGSVYSQLGSQLIAQPPFVQTSNLQTSTSAPLTLENGFPAVPSQTIANTFAVDRNYKPGYAQSWTASVQESFGRSYVVEIMYNGTKGTDLDVLRIPNRALPGSQLTAQDRRLIPYASAFTFDSSVGNSIYHALQLRFTRRFSRSSSFNIFYTFSKSIDDASTLGSGPVQNDQNIGAERALSSFDQRHNVRLNYNFQSPIDASREGFLGNMLRGWTIGGTLTASSGTPYTAIVTGDPSGTGFTGISRAQATGLPVITESGFFNLAAFTVPAEGTFGNAGRDTIPGIATFSLNASFFRSFRLDDKRRLEFRIDSTNPLNHVNISQINTTVGSINYGLPVGAGPMRSVTATVRLRF